MKTEGRPAEPSLWKGLVSLWTADACGGQGGDRDGVAVNLF
jgi:hypothetical protein